MGVAAAEVAGPPEPRAGAPRPPEPRATTMTTVLGAGLLAGAVLVAAFRSRDNVAGALDLTVYGAGLAGALMLLAFGVGLRVVLRDRPGVSAAAGWPLGLGAVAVGLLLAVGLGAGPATAYVAGLAVLALAVGGHVLAPGAPPAVAAVVGVLVVYLQGIEDAVDDTVLNTGFVLHAVATLVFVVSGTVVSHLATRARTAVALVVGAGGLVVLVGLLVLSAGTRTFQQVEYNPTTGALDRLSYTDDVVAVLVATGVLVAGWMLLDQVSQGPGFRVLVVTATVTVLPAAATALEVGSPTTWALVTGVLGGALLVAAGVRSLTIGRAVRSPATLPPK